MLKVVRDVTRVSLNKVNKTKIELGAFSKQFLWSEKPLSTRI